MSSSRKRGGNSRSPKRQFRVVARGARVAQPSDAKLARLALDLYRANQERLAQEAGLPRAGKREHEELPDAS